MCTNRFRSSNQNVIFINKFTRKISIWWTAIGYFSAQNDFQNMTFQHIWIYDFINFIKQKMESYTRSSDKYSSHMVKKAYNV